jgi:hypothetical protein
MWARRKYGTQQNKNKEISCSKVLNVLFGGLKASSVA